MIAMPPKVWEHMVKSGFAERQGLIDKEETMREQSGFEGYESSPETLAIIDKNIKDEMEKREWKRKLAYKVACEFDVSIDIASQIVEMFDDAWNSRQISKRDKRLL